MRTLRPSRTASTLHPLGALVQAQSMVQFAFCSGGHCAVGVSNMLRGRNPICQLAPISLHCVWAPSLCRWHALRHILETADIIGVSCSLRRINQIILHRMLCAWAASGLDRERQQNTSSRVPRRSPVGNQIHAYDEQSHTMSNQQ